MYSPDYVADYDKTGEQKAAEAVAGALSNGLAIRIIPAESVWPNMPTGGSIDDAPGTVQERVASLKKHLAKPDPVGDVGKAHPLGDVGKVPSASALLKVKEPDDWLIDQFGMRGSLLVLGGATGASKSTLVHGMAQAISEGTVWGGQLYCNQGKALVIQSDESERNAPRKLQVMDMDPSSDLLNDMPELDLASSLGSTAEGQRLRRDLHGLNHHPAWHVW